MMRMATPLLRPFLPRGLTAHPIQIARLNCEWVLLDGREVPKPGEPFILYFHGGAYALCSPKFHRILTYPIAKRTGLPVLSATYRLIPEHPCPAQVDDARAIFTHLLDEGHEAKDIRLAGDSAGGGLCLALMHELRAHDLPMPARATLMSPFTDMTASGASAWENRNREPLFTHRGYKMVCDHFRGEIAKDDPRHSPLFGPMEGLPPIQIFVGSTEIVRDDGTRLAAKIKEAGGEVELHEYPKQIHVWQAFHPLLPEARRALDEIAAFLTA